MSAVPARGVQAQTSAGNVRPGRTGPPRLDTPAGHVTAGGITGNAEISAGSGKVQIGEVEGPAVVKNSNGDTTIDAVTGDARGRAANGGIRVERAGAGVDAKTYGDITIYRSLTTSGPGERQTMTSKQSRPAIAATGLRKSSGDQIVPDGLDLNVQRRTGAESGRTRSSAIAVSGLRKAHGDKTGRAGCPRADLAPPQLLHAPPHMTAPDPDSGKEINLCD